MTAAKAKKEAREQVKSETDAKQTEKKDEKPVTFLCKFCGQAKPVGGMAILNRYSPPMTACRECEKALR